MAMIRELRDRLICWLFGHHWGDWGSNADGSLLSQQRLCGQCMLLELRQTDRFGNADPTQKTWTVSRLIRR